MTKNTTQRYILLPQRYICLRNLRQLLINRINKESYRIITTTTKYQKKCISIYSRANIYYIILYMFEICFWGVYFFGK